MYRRAVMAQRSLRGISRPLMWLAIVSLLSLGARVAWLGQPCRDPCRSAADHLLVFDESYYVNAARVIAGVAPPASSTYTDAPLGHDPNSEHPQLAKLAIAGSIELFGDGPFAWRLTSVVLGSVAIVGMFALTRAAGGGQWLALIAAALMASDNLLLVHGRIGTLDVPVLAAMIWGAVLYLRGRPVWAGALIGVGACIKLVAPYTLLALGCFEALRILVTPERGALRGVAARLAACASVAATVFIALLAILDRIAPPYDATAGKRLASGPLPHITHMFTYAANQTSPHGPRGIASYPWTWIVDYKPITYLNINPARPAPGLYHVHPAVHFVGLIAPTTLLLGVPALMFTAWGVGRRSGRAAAALGGRIVAGAGGGLGGVGAAAGEGLGRLGAAPADRTAILALAWFVGTFAPFALLSLLTDRTSYLYYMVIVMPGVYLAAAHVVWRLRAQLWLLALWLLAAAGAAIALYPLTPLP
jgi:4-amino-4-deoxy-L-arabinose transferase-like glycosyltransferase